MISYIEYEQTKNSKSVFDAILVLEYGLLKCKSNSQFKLLLIQLYKELRVIKRTNDLYVSLNIKQIQLDTLSFYLTDDFGFVGNEETELQSLIRPLEIYRCNNIEV